MLIVLGNRDAMDAGTPMPVGRRATRCMFPDTWPPADLLTAVTHPEQGVWARHALPGASPAWVASDNPQVAAALADHYGCPVRTLEPEETP